MVGKWNLGLESPNTPTERGFDFYRGFLGDMMDDYYTHRRFGNNYMRENLKEIDPQGHATEIFSDWAIRYPVSYTHLDVYKRQGLFRASGNLWWGTYYIDGHFHGRSS